MEGIEHLAHFNKHLLMDKISGKEAIYQRLIDSAIQSFPAYFSEIKEAIKAEDHMLIGDIAHTIKGAAATLCFARLEEIAFKLEKSDSDFSKIAKLVGLMEEEFEVLKQLVKHP